MSQNSEMPWRAPGKWVVSMHNWAKSVRADWNLPLNVAVHDVTLRDGEQSPGVVFRLDEKLRIAHALADAGVHRIEAGMPAVSQEDAEAMTRIAKEIRGAEIVSFCRARKGDVDLALKCNVQSVVIELAATEVHIRNIWGSQEKAVESLVDVIKHAKSSGLKVYLFIMESSRADIGLLENIIIPGVRDGKADSVAIVDTRGCALPEAMVFLIKKIKEWVNVPIEVHCHNNWGLATANTLAAVTAGAEVIHTCINGIGGNAALDECVLGVEGLLGLQTGIQTQKLLKMSQMVKEFSRSDWYKPFVGPSASHVEVGMATQLMWEQRHEPEMGRAQIFNFEVVGGKDVTLVLGKKSGRHSILLKSMELGLDLPSDEQVSDMLSQVKNLSVERKGLVTDDEFRQIYQEVMAKYSA